MNKDQMTTATAAVFDVLEMAAARRPLLLMALHLVEQLVLTLLANGQGDALVKSVADKVKAA